MVYLYRMIFSSLICSAMITIWLSKYYQIHFMCNYGTKNNVIEYADEQKLICMQKLYMATAHKSVGALFIFSFLL